MLIGLGIWLTQGGPSRPIPTPIWYWVGVGLMVVGAGVAIYGWRYGNRLIKEENENLLDEIKSVLIEIDTCEKDAAVRKGKQTHSRDIAKRVIEDAADVLGDLMPFLTSMLENVLGKGNIDYPINFFAKIAGIMDTEDYGLKAELSSNQDYVKLGSDLTKKRVSLRVRRKKRTLIEKNIDRICTLTYGINSSIIFREVVKSMPEARIVPREIMVALESMESAMRKLLPKMLNDLDNEWKVVVNFNELL